MRSSLLVLALVVMAVGCSAAEAQQRSTGKSEAPKGEGEGEGTGNEKKDPYDSTPAPTSGLGKLRFMPDVAFSGFDGEHTFVVPIAVYDADKDDLKVTLADPSAATVAQVELEKPVNDDGIRDNGTYFFITIKKPTPAITLSATSKGRTAEAKINVTTYDTNRWVTGDTRYRTGNTTANNPPCMQCHSGGASIDHSPATMASAPDNQIALIITSGIKPGPSYISTNCSSCDKPGQAHRWTVTDQERDGLITYLRSLTPRGFLTK
jgi:hypothetical protein